MCGQIRIQQPDPEHSTPLLRAGSCRYSAQDVQGSPLPQRVRNVNALDAHPSYPRRHAPSQVSENETDGAVACLVAALRAAHDARRGLPADLQPIVRAYGRSRREAGESIGHVLIEVKRLVREHAAADEAVFTPKIVGWTVAGFFEGAASPD
jgi:hypothetical protein